MGTVLVVVLAVLAAAGVAVLAERYLHLLGERLAADALRGHLGAATTVTVLGPGFLRQALRGRFRAVEVTGDDVVIGALRRVRLHARLRNVRIPLRVLLRGRVAEVPCDHLSGSLVLPWTELAAVVRVPGLTGLALDFRDERLLATASLPVPGVSQLARVGGQARLSVDEDGAVWLRMRGLSVAGVSVPDLLMSQLVPNLTVPIPLPALPYGLRLQTLTPEPDGLVVTGSGSAVVIRRLESARPRPLR